ncbi:hypothetical protein ACFFU8_09380 [Chromobacterium piscinae]|uniref:hypothetical protein n=1 Tax=Chromobacterium piscinae TaxID=686831 RepID=UPI001E56E0FC|nr:hypothetical protein [Chromobacterium piscinae]MCD5327884.1 hypothetical protein [Chromobacterium piscinae]
MLTKIFFFVASVAALIMYATNGAPTTSQGITTLIFGVVGLLYNGVVLLRK